MRFLVDAQLPPGLAQALANLGDDAEHVCDVGLGSARDQDVWRYAEAHGAIIVTKDADFAALRTASPNCPSVLWLRIGNTTNIALWAHIEPLLPDIIQALEAGERLIEIR